MSANAPSTAGAHDVPSEVRPAGATEFTPRAVIVALLVAALIASSYPYIVLKLGFGPNIAVVAAFFGYLMLALVARHIALRWESNLAQAAGVIAGQTSFMCTVLAAFDMLSKDKDIGVDMSLTPMQIFLWLLSAGTLGVLMAVPMRRHFIVDEKLPYADGIAAGETLKVLDARGVEAKLAVRAMIAGLVSSAVATLATMLKWIPIEEVILRVHRFAERTRPGFALSLLAIGSGMIIGLRICLNMAAGLVLSWVIAPLVLVNAGVLTEEFTRRDLLLWVMWPATGLMTAGGLTALFLKWKVVTKSFRAVSAAGAGTDEFPLRWVAIGSLFAAIAVVLVQYFALGLPIWASLCAIVLSVPLMLVGLRVFGETNWGPISALSNLMQGIFGAIAPGNIQANMVASGLTGTVAANSEGMMQAYKTGDMIGSKPRYLTYVQLMAVPVAALAVAIVYPMLQRTYRIGDADGLVSPISQKWYGFAKLLGKGISTLHPSALWALGIAVVLGVVLTVLEQRRSIRTWVPSPTGIGIGMLVPGTAVATMLVGALTDWFARRLDPKGTDRWLLPLASGFIAGEALIAVILSIAYGTGLLALPK